MGLFSRSAPLATEFTSITQGYRDMYERGSLKHIAKHQQRMLSQLRPTESFELITVHASGLRADVAAITNERVLGFTSGQITASIERKNVTNADAVHDPWSSPGSPDPLLFVRVTCQSMSEQEGVMLAARDQNEQHDVLGRLAVSGLA